MKEFFEVDPENEGRYYWLTVNGGKGQVSIRIKADHDGVVVDMWPAGEEIESPEASTWMPYPRVEESQYE